MPRTARMVIPDQQAVYHVMSRTALDKFPIGSVEKDHLLKLIKRFSKLYFTEILGFCLMGNHFHLLVKMVPDDGFSDDDIEKRLKLFYGKDYQMPNGQIPLLRLKLASLSEFVQRAKWDRYLIDKSNSNLYKDQKQVSKSRQEPQCQIIEP
jgi:REP element-mobilizing transposase RayT